MADTGELLDALKQFRELPPSEREKIVHTVETSHPALDLLTIARSVSIKTEHPQQFLIHLLSWIGGFMPEAASRGFARSLAKRVSEWLDEVVNHDNEDTQTSNVFQAQLQRLLETDAIGITSKAQRVMWGHGKVFREAYVTTQIRPIFPRDLTANPKNAVLVHELKIDFNGGGTSDSLCVVMDRRQIVQLREVLQRALVKEERLQANADFRYLTSEE